MALEATVFARRRREFLARIGEGAAAVLAAAGEVARSNDVDYRYRQNSDFYYLTGCDEPDALALFLCGHGDGEYVLFVRPRDAQKETWTGSRLGVEGARSQLGADVAYTIAEAEEKVPEFLAERQRLYCGLDRNNHALQLRVLRWLHRARSAAARAGGGPGALIDVRDVLHEMRLRKEAAELELLRQAVDITAEAHCEVMRKVHAGQTEFEVEAALEYMFRRRGATGAAYPSICAAGANATVLHYTANNARLHPRDLLLIDAGAEFEYYCADLTRTVPVALCFEARARAVYEVVLSAQLSAIGSVRPGATLDDVHQAALGVLIDGLRDLGLVRAGAEEIREKELYKPFYMHRTSHWLGMDVHDVGRYRVGEKARALEQGMVLTVEPGLYIAMGQEGVAEEWQGIGVRIEDDVVVSETGCEVLTAAVPKAVADVEALRREGGGAAGE